jgi:hypothetical protein
MKSIVPRLPALLFFDAICILLQVLRDGDVLGFVINGQTKTKGPSKHA